MKFNGKITHKAMASAGLIALANRILSRQKSKSYCESKGQARLVIFEFYENLKIYPPLCGPRSRPQKVTPIARPKPEEGFYWSEAWRSLRYAALKNSKGCCELCGSGPSAGKPLHVDHIKPRSRYPELELTPSNLQVLCHDCNLGKGNKDSIDWRRA